MAAKNPGHGQERAWQFALGILSAVLIAVVFYLARQTQRNEFDIEQLKKDRDELVSTVTAIKQSVVKMGLSNDPKNAAIIGALVVDKPTAQGIDLFRDGKIQQAVALWQAAESRGSRDAAIALQAAGFPSDRIEVAGARIVNKSTWEKLVGDRSEKDRPEKEAADDH